MSYVPHILIALRERFSDVNGLDWIQILGHIQLSPKGSLTD